ncbi:GNAT family N-acetyltransferase [soil metagenome]
MNVRSLTDHDLPGLLELLRRQDDEPEHRAMSPEVRSEEELELELSSTDPFNEILPLVMAEGGRVLAYVSLCRYEGETFLEGPLMVPELAPEAVTPLLERVVAEARIRELDFLEAFIEDRNERAQAALALVGFAPFRTTYIYEMARGEEPKVAESPDARFEWHGDVDTALYRELYRETNDAWASRLGWNDEELEARFRDPRVQLMIAYQEGKAIGHVELEFLEDGVAEIAYFGVLPAARGHGLGRALLSHGLQRAFANDEVELVLARAHDDERPACHAIEQVGFRLAHGVIAHTLELDPSPQSGDS